MKQANDQSLLTPHVRRVRPIRGLVVAMTLLCGMWVATPSSAGYFVVPDQDEARLMQMRIRASQFLHRATFGPTMEDIETLANRMRQVGQRRAMNEWIDEQFEIPPSFHQPLAEQMIADDGFDPTDGSVFIQRYKTHAWWDIALRSEDQLRQRMAWALAQIFVTSDDGAGFMDRNPGNVTGTARWLGPANYYDMLVRNSFGNYRQLLEDVTYHPIMGVYLSHMRNRKTNGTRFPDENYAREIMQLFSIGLYELRMDGRLKLDDQNNLIPTYDNETIKEYARIFTGLTFSPRENQNIFYSGNDFMLPMVMFQPEHDTEPKTLLGGEVIDMGDGDAEVAAALDNLFNHDNVAPFIALRLIQRFVKSNPTRGYILRVARKFADNGRGERGDFKAVVRQILTDPEAFRGVKVRIRPSADGLAKVVNVLSRGTDYGRLREPVVQYTSFLRSVHAESDYADGKMMLMSMEYHWSQEPYKQPTVFSFFLPNYQPPGELLNYTTNPRIPGDALVAPEFQQKTAVTTNRTMNVFNANMFDREARFRAGNGTDYRLECNLRFDLTEEDEMVATREGLEAIIDRFDVLYCCGTMPQDYKRTMANVIHTESQDFRNSTDYGPVYGRFRTDAALLNTILSPFAAIQE